MREWSCPVESGFDAKSFRSHDANKSVDDNGAHCRDFRLNRWRHKSEAWRAKKDTIIYQAVDVDVNMNKNSPRLYYTTDEANKRRQKAKLSGHKSDLVAWCSCNVEKLLILAPTASSCSGY